MNCVQCQKTIPDSSDFCPFCGATVMPPISDPVPATETMSAIPAPLCPVCAKALPPGSDFCPFCGAIMASPVASASAPRTVPATSVTPPQAAPSPIYAAPSQYATAASSPTRANISKKTRHCHNCGAAIDPVSRKCTACGKQYFKLGGQAIAIALLSLLLCVAVFFDIVQYNDVTYLLEQRASLMQERDRWESQYNTASRSLASVRSQLNATQQTLDVYKWNFYFFKPGTYTCHAFDCTQLNGYSASDLRIIIWENAEYGGYTLCPLCIHK